MQEMALQSHKTKQMGNESLEKWELVGSGGFGRVYKARHKGWRFDVAIKIFHDTDCNLLSHSREVWKEANRMQEASSPFVPIFHGIYEGCPPVGGTSMRKGIVMEFMRRGSVQSLLTKLSGPPPWPLVVRLSYEVAQGMNFLHSNDLVHQDLKPSNVLLNDDLKAKLADFGLCRVSSSAGNSSRRTTEPIGGSFKYMPPEAFDASYQPVRAFDSYSYGILLWSIAAGKEPYPWADYSLIVLKIPMGDRPDCKEIDQMKKKGVKELVDLMQRCWNEKPSNRPIFDKCIEVTEELILKNGKEIHDAVYQVLTRLDSPTSNQHSNTFQTVAFTDLQTPEEPKSVDIVDHIKLPKSERSSMPDSVNVSTMSDSDKAKFVDGKRADLIQKVSVVMAIAEELGDMVHGEVYSAIEAKPTSQEKMRELYQRTLRSGAVKVKAAFYDALKKHEAMLVESLSG